MKPTPITLALKMIEQRHVLRNQNVIGQRLNGRTLSHGLLALRANFASEINAKLAVGQALTSHFENQPIEVLVPRLSLSFKFQVFIRRVADSFQWQTHSANGLRA